ncbi:MAG: DMT family transporter [Ardenticatenaceae bacterium]
MNVIKSTDLRTTLLLFVPGTLWGFLFLVNDIALETIPPFMFTFLRNMLTALALVMMLYLRGGRLPSTWSEWRPYFVLGLFDSAIPFVLVSWGQLHIDSGLTTILLSLIPLFTVLLAHYFSYNEPLNPQKMFGIALGLLGTLLLVGPSVLYDVGFHLWGQLAVIGATCSYAMSGIYVRLHLREQKQDEKDGMNALLKTISGQFLCSLAFVLPLTLLIDRPWTVQPSQTSLIALCISSWVITIGAALVYYHMINQVGASTASTTLYITPINGVFWGAVILSETVTWSIIMALVLILSGVVIVNKATHSYKPA